VHESCIFNLSPPLFRKALIQYFVISLMRENGQTS
jgi:hypothetical protein